VTGHPGAESAPVPIGLDLSSTGSPDRRILFSALLAAAVLAVLLAAGCGKKGDPQPPFPRGAKAVSDLAVEQEALDAVLTFSYPDRLLNGEPLTDLAAIEVYRVVNPAPALTAPRQTPRPSPSGGTRTDEAPVAGARRAAVNARVAEQSFYRDAERIAVLRVSEIARRTRGATIVVEDPLGPLLARQPAPSALAYAVVSVRRGGERSPLSNLVAISPEVPPAAPVLLAVTPEEGRICLEWLPPERDLLGRPDGKAGGYFVYRRALPEEEYGQPLNAKAVDGTAFVDVAPPYGAKLVYTVRAIVPGKPRIEGAAAIEAVVDYRDIFPPPSPARLDALAETGLIRLVWDPVNAPDLAGYAVFRSEGAAAPVRLNAELVADNFFSDATVQPGHRYTYTVKAFDRAGNASAPSPPAVAEPL
jgi:predicted small lipoprotein YifL